MSLQPLRAASALKGVTYEIRGPLARRALEIEAAGHRVIKLNIGNPGAFGFRTPEPLRQAIVDNLHLAEPYCASSKGVFSARDAIVAQQKARGVLKNQGEPLTREEVFIGNGASELIMMCLRGLIESGDEILVPSPDYPLWTAGVVIHGGTAVHYHCTPERGFVPDPAEIARLITPRTRALVLINPNNPTGAVYPRAVLEELVRIAEERGLVLFSDEIYGEMTYDGAVFQPLAPLVSKTLCASFSGLSKIWRACGYRVGWLTLSGRLDHAQDYLLGLDLLASLRLCANVAGQYAVPVALAAEHGLAALVAPGGRLYETRRALIDHCAHSRFLSCTAPAGAMYAFVKVDSSKLKAFDDQRFALDLLERKHVLIAPGRSFNVPYQDHFRTTLLPEAAEMADVLGRMEALLGEYAAR